MLDKLRRLATWPNTVRAAGLTGLAFLVVFRQHPDSTLVIAMVSMMGLPSFISLDGGGMVRQERSQSVEGHLPGPPASRPESVSEDTADDVGGDAG